MTAFVIRPATPDDIPAIFDIRTSVRDNHLSQAQLTVRGITPESILAAMREMPCLWVAAAGDTLAGFSMIDIESACLYALFVRPECEGQGIGAALLKAAEDALFAHHRIIWLVTDDSADVRAGRFYRHHGWHAVRAAENVDTRFEKTRTE